MELAVNKESGLVRFEVQGVIDESGAEAIKRRFSELDLASLKEVVFDFRNVKHIGSAGIGKLLLFYKDLAMQGGSIRIENVSSSIFDLFKVLKLNELFTISKV